MYKCFGYFFIDNDYFVNAIYKFYCYNYNLEPSNNNEIDFERFVKGLQLLSNSQMHEKLYYLKFLETDLDVYIAPEELRDMIRSELICCLSNTRMEFRVQFGNSSILEWNERSPNTVSFAFRGLINAIRTSDGPEHALDYASALNVIKETNDKSMIHAESNSFKALEKEIIDGVLKKAIQVATGGEHRNMSFVELLLLLNAENPLIIWASNGYTLF